MTRLQDYIKSPLAVVCHDAGAANLIVEWLKDYSGELRVCMEGPARVIWRKHFPDKKLIPINRVIKDSTTLLSGTGWADLEHSARIDAKIRGIKSIAVIDHWAKLTGLSVDDMDWWFVLAAYKLGILLEGTWARSLEGQANAEVGMVLHLQANWLFTVAGQRSGIL